MHKMQQSIQENRKKGHQLTGNRENWKVPTKQNGLRMIPSEFQNQEILHSFQTESKDKIDLYNLYHGNKLQLADILNFKQT